MAGVGIEALGKDDGKRIGELLALAGSADVVDAHVALMTAPADLVLTSADSPELRHLACDACEYLIPRGDTGTAHDLASDLRGSGERCACADV